MIGIGAAALPRSLIDLFHLSHRLPLPSHILHFPVPGDLQMAVTRAQCIDPRRKAVRLEASIFFFVSHFFSPVGLAVSALLLPVLYPFPHHL